MRETRFEQLETEEKKEEEPELPPALKQPEPAKNDDFGDFDDSDESESESSSSNESESSRWDWLFMV